MKQRAYYSMYMYVLQLRNVNFLLKATVPINDRDVKTNTTCMPSTLAWAMVLHLIFANRIAGGSLVVQYICWCR